MRAITLALVMILAAFAGCLGSSDDDTTPASQSAAETANETDPLVPDASGASAAHVYRDHLVDFHGSLGNFVEYCEFDATSNCYATPTSRNPVFHLDPLGGNVTEIHLGVAWTASSPLTTRLGFYVIACIESDDNMRCEWIAGNVGEGAVHIAAEDIDIPAEATLRLGAYYPQEYPSGFYAEFEQEFDMEGTLRVRHEPAS